MKILHLQLITLALGITLSAEKCKDKNVAAPSSAAPKATIAGAKWSLQTINGKPFQLPEGVENPWLMLDAKASTISGFGGCNQLMGSLKMEGDAISFPGLGSTKMMCVASQEVENRFMGALRSTSGYKLEGDKLTLNNMGKEMATFRRSK